MHKKDLNGQRILIIEDDYFLAREICEAITAVGGLYAGPYGAIPTEYPLQPIDAAVLDVHVRGQLVFEFADQLVDREVPFVFATAANPNELPQSLRGRPILSKPINPLTLITVLRELCVLSGSKASQAPVQCPATPSL